MIGTYWLRWVGIVYENDHLIQDMKEKMNMADAKDQESSDESEIDTARQNQMAQASATKAQLLAQNAESYKLSIPTILEPSSS